MRDTSPPERPSPTATQPLIVSPSGGRILPAGTVLSGTYEVRDLLGEGGMGQVFEAHDLLLNRRVAIKVAWPDQGVPSVRKEAQALAIIQHPSLPQVHAFGLHDGREYVVMERVYGVSLHERVRRRLDEGERLSIAEVVELVRAVAEALEVVHSAGIVHRDVKPSNIMLAPRGRVVLMDFGTVLPACDIERDKRLMGTPEYVAPEAIQGHLRAASAHLVDLYALGVLAYELLAGKLPFYAKGSPQNTLLAHLEQPVPDVRRERPDAPAPLATLVQDLLAKSPEERPGADEVLWRARALEADPQRRSLEILVVNDRPERARDLALAARQALPSALVRIAASGDEALACIDERCPDLLVADLDLKGVNGLELCMYLQGSGRRVPIVMVCGRPRPRDARLLSQLGVRQLIPTTHGWIERFRAAITDASRRAAH